MSSKKNRQAAARAVLAQATPEQLKDAGISVQPLATAVQVDVATNTEAPTTEKPSRARRPAGLGHPTAKKLINPQHTLEMKKTAAQKLGGTMVYQNKNWIIHVPAGEFKIPSRTLAGFSLASFIQEISQKRNPASDSAPPAEVKTDAETQVEEEAQDTAQAA